ncbi:protease inhibitor Inh/omp19 family protein [Chelativorans sp. AA-79]|uniref:protease inhibitor Inh/omp19 family protein n=1 Tax=Chelativorans sp. AA-79 TaxID=3028735 RepID=UPI0023F81A6E|nr:protease inhibitor Inh/omp19 family protein [Chelativorans sp. AA-79]WEX09892.1 protease inhibitor Inh/omp19 family protein [Chelativorans sp. AA-79]
MPSSKTGVFAISLLALALAGCQSERLNPVPARAPQPLPAAPSGTVTGSQLPPPAQPGAGGFPPAPGQTGTEMAAVDPAGQAAAASAAPIEKNSLLGSWSVNTGGSTCQMFLTLTKYGNSSRGGTRGCSNELANMRAWDVAGNQVVVYDEGGNTIARLNSTGAGSYSGQTTGGSSISLSR